MGCCQAREESMKVAMYGKDGRSSRQRQKTPHEQQVIEKKAEKEDDIPEVTPRDDPDESVGFEFPVNVSAAIDEDDSFIRRQMHSSPSADGVAFSAQTVEVSETGS